jgi:hypothetical protein
MFFWNQILRKIRSNNSRFGFMMLFLQMFQNPMPCVFLLAPKRESPLLGTKTKLIVQTFRMVLLRGFDDKGFVFFTNYGSRKSKEMMENPNVALNFWWASLSRQVIHYILVSNIKVRIEGTAQRVSLEESTAYFESRPRTSKIGKREVFPAKF